MSKRIVMNLLADRPIAYHPDIARVAGGVKAGIFLSQLLYWSDKGKRGDGYIWKTQSEWEEETALTRREQESARKILKSKGLLLEKRQGIPAKLYYKIDVDILYTLLDELYVQASMHESAIQDATEAPNSDARKRQSITESTTKTTTKSTTESKPATPQHPPLTHFLNEWKRLFPNKPQPRSGNKKLQKQWATRFKDDGFEDDWLAALSVASRSKTLQSEKWFDAGYFLRSEETWNKCLNDFMAWKDEKEKPVRQIPRHEEAPQVVGEF